MALLKRRAGSTLEEFRTHYVERHGPMAIPLFLANGVTYYAQTHRPLHWSSPEIQQKFEAQDVNLEDWDAVAETQRSPPITVAEAGKPGRGQAYYDNVVLPDEKRFLLSAAREHLLVVGAGSVEGEKVEFIVGGKAVVDYEEWRREREELEGA